MKHSHLIAFAAVIATATGCKPSEPPKGPRAELRQITGNTFEILPTDGSALKDPSAPLFCLVFTQSQTGIVRQLTMTHENKSLHCEPGKPIGGVRYRIPVNEGEVKVHVFFSDQKLNAGSIAAQLYEKKGDPSFHPMDLRLPGDVVVETLEFHPQPPTSETSPFTGAEVGPSGEIRDAGAAPLSAVTDGGPASAKTDAGNTTSL